MLEPFEINFPNTFEIFDPTITDKTYVGNYNTGGSKIFEYVLIGEKGNFIYLVYHLVFLIPILKNMKNYLQRLFKLI